MTSPKGTLHAEGKYFGKESGIKILVDDLGLDPRPLGAWTLNVRLANESPLLYSILLKFSHVIPMHYSLLTR